MTLQPYSDAMDRAYDVATARIAKGLGDLGVTDAFGGMMPGGLNPDFGAQGNLLIYRTRTCNGVRTSEPDYIGVLDQPPWLSEADLAALDRHVSRHVRRTLRERALGERDEDPAWSYTMHRLPRAILLEAGIDPLMLSKTSEPTTTRIIDALTHHKGISYGMHSIEDGRIDVHGLTWRGLEFVGKGRPCVIIDRPLPDTLAMALSGRLLSDAVSHPAVDRAGPIRIVEAETNAAFTTLVLEDVQDHVRRPPAGTDRQWMRVPYLPTNTD